VILGRNDVDNRIKRFTGVVLGSLHEELDRVEQIDLRYTNGFAIRWLGNSQNLFESGLENNG
jgi:cell division protein FtsQ